MILFIFEEQVSEVRWPCNGVFCFPGRAAPRVRLDPAVWSGPHISRSTGLEYHQNKQTRESCFSKDLKRIPLNFKNCLGATVGWKMGKNDVSQEDIFKVADEPTH